MRAQQMTADACEAYSRENVNPERDAVEAAGARRMRPSLQEPSAPFDDRVAACPNCSCLPGKRCRFRPSSPARRQFSQPRSVWACQTRNGETQTGKHQRRSIMTIVAHRGGGSESCRKCADALRGGGGRDGRGLAPIALTEEDRDRPHCNAMGPCPRVRFSSEVATATCLGADGTLSGDADGEAGGSPQVALPERCPPNTSHASLLTTKRSPAMRRAWNCGTLRK